MHTILWDPQGSVTGPGSIYLLVTSISEKWEVFSNADPITHQNNSNQFDKKIAKGRYSGYSNPIITINGNIDLNYSVIGGQYQPSDGSFITTHHLGSLSRFGNKYWLYDDMFGYNSTTGKNGSVCVMVKPVERSRAADDSSGSGYAEFGAIVKYTLEFIQVHEDS